MTDAILVPPASAPLPDLPPGIRLLSNVESDQLRAEHPNVQSSVKHCLTCDGTRKFLWRDSVPPFDVVEYDCPCEDQLILHRYLLHCGIGTAYQRLGWQDLTGAEPGGVQACMSWLDEAAYNMRAGMSLVLTGNKGTGKTLLSILLAKALLAQGFDGYFTTFPTLIDKLLSSWRSNDEAKVFHARCRNSGFLVIDDVGREMKQRRMVAGEGMKDYETASSQFALESVLRHRISMASPFILTTNLTIEQLAQHYGAHFKSLLTESAQVYEFTGADFRPQALVRTDLEKTHKLFRPVVVG